jgi:hypothetical protein
MASVGIHSRYEMLTIAIATAVKMIKRSRFQGIPTKDQIQNRKQRLWAVYFQ